MNKGNCEDGGGGGRFQRRKIRIACLDGDKIERYHGVVFMRCNEEIKAAVRRKKAAWKEVLATRDQEAKERCMEAYREEKRKVKMCIIQSKKKVNEQFGRKINEDVNENRKLFWKELRNARGGKV